MAEEKEIGKITHYYDKISVAVVELKAALKTGDSIHIKGHATDFTQDVESIQIEHEEIKEAKKGDHIGMKVSEEVKEHDIVYKVAS
ncbi:MAG: translation elongation factor-like protein [Candidatus Woykebacteria bacterium RBG_13_40_7b]|uniref:Translation elongation factor-like protein n=1 Tax=Candidatus Woykebacteria bacterium RBG_13_40_7b TaxID=1802594 RepID=A0A1G1W6A9_9BACT|nr:MAG: translation elongation factor-like protein [Candidatus Woykebacteria bacterium RBG_13_40_7b]